MPYGVNVEFVSGTPNPESLVEYAGRTCYNSNHKHGTDSDIIQRWIRDGHLSVLEHASITVSITASRALTHELVRHRLASYSQQSQRYVTESEARYTTPPEFSGEDLEVYDELMNKVISTYRVLREKYPSEIARYVLPNSWLTTIVCTWNLREIRHILQLRSSPRALPEIREMARQLLKIAVYYAPTIFSDLCEDTKSSVTQVSLEAVFTPRTTEGDL